MDITTFKKILAEEIHSVLNEASITKRFTKAVEAYRTIQVKQQELRKKFVAEKDPKKKEALKQSLISLHKKVQKAESDFNSALKSEPIDDLTEKSQGLWANIHAKRKRGEKPAKKGSKAHKKAVKAARSINKSEGKLNESPTDILASDIGGKVYNATGGRTAQAQKTNKTFDDGVPVLKNIARAKKETVKLPKKFKVVVDERYGWYYYFDKGYWYGIDKKKYSTPPFEY